MSTAHLHTGHLHAGHLHAGHLHAARRMLQAPWQWRRNDGSLWALRLWSAVTVLIFGVPALSALLWAPARVAWPVVSLLGLCAVVGLFITQFAALLRLDHPHAAHAVPGHRSAVRLAALLAWAAGVLASGAATALVVAVVSAGSVRAGLAAALAAGTVMMLVAATYRWWWLWLLPSSMAIPGWSGTVVQAASWAHGVWQAQPLAVTALVLLAQGLALCGVFGHGDAAHADVYARRERLRLSLLDSRNGKATPLSLLGRWGERLGRPLQRLGDAWLSRVCARAQPGLGSVMARAEIVLFGNEHGLRNLAMVLFVQACLLAGIGLVVALAPVNPATLLKHGQLGISIGLASMCLGALVGTLGALWHSRREQALLMLLPGMPQGPALNFALARRQARHGLLVWLSTLPGLLLVAWAGAAPELLAFPLTVLPLLAWQWRDHSRLRRASPVQNGWPYAFCLTLGSLSVALLRWQPAAWLPWLAVVLGLTALLLRWRWQRLARLPQALPAGRLA